MKTLLLVALVAGLGLSACATKPILPPSTELSVAKGETLLEVAYNAAGTTYMAKRADLAPADKARCKEGLQTVYRAIVAVRAGERLANAETVAGQVNEAWAALKDIGPILHVSLPIPGGQ